MSSAVSVYSSRCVSTTSLTPLRQKIVSAVTSGLVPDLFQNNPAEIIALYAWQDKLVDRRSF